MPKTKPNLIRVRRGNHGRYVHPVYLYMKIEASLKGDMQAAADDHVANAQDMTHAVTIACREWLERNKRPITPAEDGDLFSKKGGAAA